MQDSPPDPLDVRTDPSPPPMLDGGAADLLALDHIVAGRYRVRARLGTGGMGAVWRVHDRELDEEVALKVLLPGRPGDRATLRRFRREVKIARRITHPNVCRVFDFGEDDGLCFLTMELVEGRSLRAALEEGPPAPEQALRLMMQVAEGLSAVHAQGVVHRDLKPENVIVRRDGQAVVADFGVAWSRAADARTTGAAAGTPAYMSPEQLRGEAPDPRSDIFALGLLAFEVLSGGAPFGNGAPATIASAILRDPPRPLVVPGLPDGVVRGIEGVLARALAKRPEDRFATAGAFAAALREAWVAGMPADTERDTEREPWDESTLGERGASVEPPAATTRAPRAPRGGRARSLVAAVVSLGLLAAGALWRWPAWDRAAAEEATAGAGEVVATERGGAAGEDDLRPRVLVARFENLTGDPSWDALAEGAADAVRASLRTMREVRLLEGTQPAEGASAGEQPTWIVGGSVQRVGSELRLAAQMRAAGAAPAGEPIEVDGPPERPAELLDALRGRALDEARLLWREHDRRARAERGTTDATARAKLLQYYGLIGPALLPEHCAPGKLLLDEALAADPSYVPALLERAYLQVYNAVMRDGSGINAGLKDLDRALELAPADPHALVMRCRLTQIAVQDDEHPTDATIEAAIDMCNAAMQAEPSSGHVPFVLARLYNLGCQDDQALASLQRAMDLDRTLEGHSLQHMVVLALENDKLFVADRASQRLVEVYQDEQRQGARALSRRAGRSPTRLAHVLRAATLERLGRLQEAQAALELQAQMVAGGLREGSAEAAALRGLVRIARRQGVQPRAELERRLATLERQHIEAAEEDPGRLLRLASEYQWTDPEVAARLLDRLPDPSSFGNVYFRALSHYMAGNHTAARRMIDEHMPTQSWERRCIDGMHARLDHHKEAPVEVVAGAR